MVRRSTSVRGVPASPGGPRRATGRPRTVTVKVSPACAARSTAAMLLRSSRYLIAALEATEERMRAEHRRLMRSTFYAVPGQDKLAV